jgi:hypothetical protein
LILPVLALGACRTPTTSEPCDACGGECTEDSMEAPSRSHTEEPVDYPQSPPSGGDHSACWTTWGVHTEEVAPEHWVHNLEHGGVVFLWNCPEGCDEDVATLTTFVEGLPEGRAVMTSYPDMDVEIAAIAWEHRLLLGCLDTDALQTFFDEHVGHGPEDLTSDPAASCME